MEIVIDADADTPPFAQLVAQIKQAVSAGVLAPGDPLPSIRQLANDVELNNKTVAKAYRLLERDTIVESKGYRGTFVHADAKAHCDIDLEAFAIQKLEAAVSVLRQAGLTDAEVRKAFRTAMTDINRR